MRRILREGEGGFSCPAFDHGAFKDADQSLEKMRSKKKDDDAPDDLLTEPDDMDECPKSNEVSAISTGGGALQSTGAIRGVTTPLGTTSIYPSKQKKKPKSKRKAATDVNARAFGGGDVAK